MHKHLKLAALTLALPIVIAACGGGSSSSVAPPDSDLTDAQRAAAATTTATSNPMCSALTLGAYYWEIGDANGVKAAGSVGIAPPEAATPMWVFSASKWLYAANVVQKRGVVDADVPFLNFTSGYSEYGNAPKCDPGPGADTVQGCVPPGGRDLQNPATIGKFFYDSGHMQHHGATVMGLGPSDNAALAADLNATLGDFGFGYTVPQLAAGVVVTPQGYAGFLRRLLRGELALGGALGTRKVCASPDAPGCDALSSPWSGTNEAWSYSLGHWVEDDPVIGDHAFSSAGGGGFYPWIDRTGTYYGILAREREFEADAGYHSAQCGRLVRQAWVTGQAVTATLPTP